MINSVLVDTSFLVALLNVGDVHHQRAVEIQSEFEKNNVNLIIPDVVVNESLAVLQRRLAEKGQEDFVRIGREIVNLWKKDQVFFYIYVVSNWVDVINLVFSSNGKLNFHDALLIVEAKKKGIDRIASFDFDFDGYLDRIG